jgi:hypothetical protein
MGRTLHSCHGAFWRTVAGELIVAIARHLVVLTGSEDSLEREAVHAGRMRAGKSFSGTPQDRLRLGARESHRQTEVREARQVILATADGCGTNEIMRRWQLCKPVWRWQERFMREGVDGLRRDKTRGPGRGQGRA